MKCQSFVAYLATIDEIKNHEQFVSCLKGVVQIHNERVLEFGQDIAFRLCVCNLATFDNRILAQHFHGIDGSIVLLSHQHDFSKGALSNHL
jgi:hypothetical protein